MQCLGDSGAVRLIYRPLGVKGLRPITITQIGTAKHYVTLWIFTNEDLEINGKIILKWMSSRFEGRGLD